jgi:hypothetical protein
MICTRLDEGSESNISRTTCQRSKHAGLNTGRLNAPLFRSAAVFETKSLLRKLLVLFLLM